MEKISDSLGKIAHFLELLLAIFITVGVLSGFANVVKYIVEVYNTDLNMSYEFFTEFLSYVLMLVVGVEFVLMLLTHSIENIVRLVVFVIARKMLIYGHSMTDMVFGGLALAIVFATLKFLVPGKPIEIETNRKK